MTKHTITPFHITVIEEEEHHVLFEVEQENGGPDNLEDVIHFNIKWDGCMDMNAPLLHLCGVGMLKSYGEVLTWMVLYAAESMTEHLIRIDGFEVKMPSRSVAPGIN